MLASLALACLLQIPAPLPVAGGTSESRALSPPPLVVSGESEHGALSPPPLVARSEVGPRSPLRVAGRAEPQTTVQQVEAEPEYRRLSPLGAAGLAAVSLGWFASWAHYFDVRKCQPGFLFEVCEGTSEALLLPVVGPWIGLATGDVPNQHIPAAVALGVVQTLGLVSAVVGFSVKIPISKEVGELELSASGARF